MAIQPTQAGAQIEPRDGLSYVRGATDIPLSDATVSRFLLDTVAPLSRSSRGHVPRAEHPLDVARVRR